MGSSPPCRAVAVLVADEESLRRGGRPRGGEEPEDDTTCVLVSGRVQEQGLLALPGGKVEAGDASLAHAAARELEEETGLVFPAGAFRVVHTLNGPDWVVTLLLVRCPAEKKQEVRNMEPEKHGPWTWRTWGDLQREPAERVYGPLRKMLNHVTLLRASGDT